MIKGSDLQNRRVDFPEPQEAEVVRESLKTMKGAVLAERLAKARELRPPDAACRACFTAGRDAAIAALAVEGSMADRLAAAKAVQSRHYHNGDRSFQVGRDAVIALVLPEA